MSQLSKQDLKAENQLQFPNNNNGAITPANLRAFNVDLIDSTVNQTDFINFSGSVADQLAAATGAVDSSITGSSLITASFSGNTITFTKGDASTFGILIPDISGSTIDTGSLVTTQSFNEYTASNDTVVNALVSATASYADSASVALVDSNQQAQIDALIAFTGSVTASIDTGSFATTGSNTFNGNQIISGSVIPLNNFGGELGASDKKWTRLYTNEINGLSNLSLDAARFSDSDLPLGFIQARQLFANGSDGPDVALYYATSSSDVNSLRQLAYVVSSSGNNPDLGQVSASFAATISSIVAGTGFATTGSNTFRGNQTLISSSISLQGSGQISLPNGFVLRGNAADIAELNSQTTIQFITEPPAGPGGTNDIKFINRVSSSVISFENGQAGAGNQIRFVAGEVIFDIGARSGSNGKVEFGNNTTAIEALSTPILAQRLELSGALTASLQEGYAYVGNSIGKTIAVPTSSFGVGGGSTDTGSLLVTASANLNVITFTKGDASTFNITVDTGSGGGGGGTTYENPTLNTYSGSLILAGNGFTSASFDYISASVNGLTNLIFRSANQAFTTVISGSNNILGTFAIPMFAGFRRQFTGGNIAIGAGSIQLSGSMEFPITINNNIVNQDVLVRGPVSASSWNISGNTINGIIQIGTGPTTSARGLDDRFVLTNNTINTGFNIIANAESIKGSPAGAVTISGNTLAGGTFNIRQSGISAANNFGAGFTVNNDYFSGSAGFGLVGFNGNNLQGSNTINFSGSLDSGVAVPNPGQPIFTANIAMGISNVFRLDPTGRGGNHSIAGHGIIGSNLILTGSSSPANLATLGGMHIGRFNAVDGNRALTAETVFAVGTGTAAASRKTGFLIDSGSNTFVEGTLNVSGSTSLSGSLTIQSGSSFFANGNKQFNVGAFSSLVTQSGSANVSQSVTFDTTDISDGVSVESNSEITFANSGTYSITFSAQILANGGQDTVRLWLKKNGENVPNTTTKIIGKNGEETVLTVNYVVDAISNDYYEIVFQNNSGNGTLLFEAASGNFPATPSIILTAVQVR